MNRPAATLLIGFGNTLRRDDGAGPALAAEIARWGLANVSALAVPQLVPELAEPLAAARRAWFLDARLATESDTIRIEPLTPAPEPPALDHAHDPRALLALARAVFGAAPEAWLVTIPGTDFGFGEGLSSSAARAVETARAHLDRLLRDELPE